MPEPRRVDKPLVLYGMGNLGRLAEEIFNELDIPIAGIFDKNSMMKSEGNNLLAICVATEPYESVIKPLKEAGWTDIVPVWDIIEAYPEVGIHNGWFYHSNGDGTEKTLEVLNGLRFSTDRKQYGQYFDYKIARSEYQEVNIQTKCLDSTLKAIRARQRVEMYEPSSRINIHAEGCELETIQENLPMLKKTRPYISVSCYHSEDGLYRVPLLLMSELNDYVFDFTLTAYMGQGAYLICTPEEKI